MPPWCRASARPAAPPPWPAARRASAGPRLPRATTARYALVTWSSSVAARATAWAAVGPRRAADRPPRPGRACAPPAASSAVSLSAATWCATQSAAADCGLRPGQVRADHPVPVGRCLLGGQRRLERADVSRLSRRPAARPARPASRPPPGGAAPGHGWPRRRRVLANSWASDGGTWQPTWPSSRSEAACSALARLRDGLPGASRPRRCAGTRSGPAPAACGEPGIRRARSCRRCSWCSASSPARMARAAGRGCRLARPRPAGAARLVAQDHGLLGGDRRAQHAARRGGRLRRRAQHLVPAAAGDQQRQRGAPVSMTRRDSRAGPQRLPCPAGQAAAHAQGIEPPRSRSSSRCGLGVRPRLRRGFQHGTGPAPVLPECDGRCGPPSRPARRRPRQAIAAVPAAPDSRQAHDRTAPTRLG